MRSIDVLDLLRIDDDVLLLDGQALVLGQVEGRRDFKGKRIGKILVPLHFLGIYVDAGQGGELEFAQDIIDMIVDQVGRGFAVNLLAVLGLDHGGRDLALAEPLDLRTLAVQGHGSGQRGMHFLDAHFHRNLALDRGKFFDFVFHDSTP